VPTVLFTIRYGFVARNILRTGVLRRLKAAGARVVVVTPAHNEPYFSDEAQRGGFELFPFPRLRASYGERMFAAAANVLLFDHPSTSETLRVKWRRLPEEGRWGAFAAKALMAPLRLHRAQSLRRAAERIDARWFANPEAGAIIDRVQPSLVAATDVFASEAVFVREARRRGIPTVGLVKSWDNLTSKARIRVEPDYYGVWNHIMVDEIRRFHFVDRSRVFVSGAPNFDLFGSPEFAPRSREQFFHDLGIEPHRKLVVYSPGAKFTFSDDDNIRTLHRVLQQMESTHPFHLHIRKYPKSPQRFEHLTLPNMSVGEAGVVVPAWADSVDQPLEHMQFLGELMKHADLLVHVGSTVAVDAACFDTPIVGYALDKTAHRRWWHPAPFVFDLTHNRYLTDLGGQRLAYTETQLRDEIRQYLENPARDREGRRQMVNAICGAFDGRSGDRIAEFLLGIMQGRPQDAMRGSLAQTPG